MAVASAPLDARYHRLQITNRWLMLVTGLVLIALAAVVATQVVRTTPTLTANEKVAEQVALAPNSGGTFATGIFAPDATWVGFDGTVANGPAAIGAMAAQPVTVTLTGDPVTVGRYVVVPFTWATVPGEGTATGDGAFLFTFNDAGLITNVAQTLRFNPSN